MKQLNKSKGSILQVVLIVFMVLVLNIGVFYLNIIENSRAIKRTKMLNNERLIELSIIRYYKEMILNDILLSNVIEIENYVIDYTVDDFGNYYYIETRVKKNDDDMEIIFSNEIGEKKNVKSKGMTKKFFVTFLNILPRNGYEIQMGEDNGKYISKLIIFNKNDGKPKLNNVVILKGIDV